MPAARGVKRAASKASSITSSSGAKNKKKRGPIQLEIPKAPTKRGFVWACGQGDVGQLGLGEDVPETSRFKCVSALGNNIVEVKAGGMHTIALDSDGKVWTFGCNDEGALGRTTSDDTEEGTPTKVTLPHKAVTVSAGDSHSAALLDNGEVYAWGSFRDSHGSMGLLVSGREGKPSKVPVKIELDEVAVAIASGGDHLVVLTTSGSVYTMGCGEQGQLGRLAQRSASRESRGGFAALLTPGKVSLKVPVSRIWAGYHATFALDAHSDKVLAWGLNNYGQLGISGEKRKGALYTATECDAFTQPDATWTQVACGQHHSLAINGSGVIHAVGRCDYGRLGLGADSGDADSPVPIPKLQDKRCVSIATGTSNSYAVTDAGEAFAWGMGSEGQLGNGGSEDAAEPSQVTRPALCARLISAGGQHAVLLAEDPNRTETDAPAPEAEPAVERVEDVAEATAEAEAAAESDADEPAPPKRQKTNEEVSSSTSAQKVNGEEKKETPMDVDEAVEQASTEPTEEPKPEEPEKMEQSEPTPDVKKDEVTIETVNGTPETIPVVKEKVPEHTEDIPSVTA